MICSDGYFSGKKKKEMITNIENVQLYGFKEAEFLLNTE